MLIAIDIPEKVYADALGGVFNIDTVREALMQGMQLRNTDTNGYWKHDYRNWYACSRCDARREMSSNLKEPFCPCCGVKMEEEEIVMAESEGDDGSEGEDGEV